MPDASEPSRSSRGQRLLSRKEACERLGVSDPTLRRLDGEHLHPVQDERGQWWYDPMEVEDYYAKLQAQQGKPREPQMKTTEIAVRQEGDIRESVRRVHEPMDPNMALGGVVDILTKHIERTHAQMLAIVDTSVATMRDAVQTSQNAMKEKDDTIAKLVRERQENFEAVEDLKSKKHERELAERQAEKRMEIMASAAEKLGPVLPLLATKLMGALSGGGGGGGGNGGGRAAVAPGEPRTEGELLVDSLLESIKPEQAGALMAAFSPEQQMLMAGLFEQYEKRKKAAGKEGFKPEPGQTQAPSPDGHATF